MKEFILLLKYVKRTYTPEENERIKQGWINKMADWNARGIFVASQVLMPDTEKTVLPDGNTIDSTTPEGDYFIGATVTIKAADYDAACSIAKEAPHLALNGRVDIRELRSPATETYIYLIDTFTVPEAANEAFLARMAINRDFIKQLPGFIKDNAYEQKNDNGSFSYVTVACWKDTISIENAKKEVGNLYKKQRFDMSAFLKEKGIELRRGTYSAL